MWPPTLSMRIINIFISLLIVFFCGSCAQVVPLSGGAKDVIPPNVLETFPKNYSMNFPGRNVEIKFDEYIQLKDISSEISINPLPLEAPSFEVYNKSLKIEWRDSIRKNTTYSISFGNSIMDLHEGNILKDYQYVFSTGSQIDSFKIFGKIENALTGSRVSKVLIGLYNSYESASKNNPEYFTYSNDKGEFELKNLPDKEFYLLAFDDKNKNKLYDEDELVGFLQKPISSSDLKENSIKLFYSTIEKSFVKKVEWINPVKARICYSRKIKSPESINYYDGRKINFRCSESCDTIYVYFDAIQKDSVKFLVSRGNFLDSISIPPKEERFWNQYFQALKSKPSINSSVSLNQKLLPISELRFYTEREILNFHPQKLRIIQSGDTVSHNSYIVNQQTKDSLSLNFSFNAGNIYKVIFLPGFLEFGDGESTDTAVFNFEIKKSEEFSRLIIDVQLPDTGQFLLQLLNSKQVLVKQKNISSSKKEDSQKIIFESLNPENYFLRLIYDADKNHKFSNGSFYKKIQAEKSFHYEKEISLSEGWELELNWAVINSQ